MKSPCFRCACIVYVRYWRLLDGGRYGWVCRGCAEEIDAEGRDPAPR